MGRLVKYWPLLLIIVSTFFLRIWNLEELFYFSYDEAIPAFVGRRLILWNHIPLIGGVTPFGFHLAPYFYWFYSLLLLVGNLNPIIWGYAGAAIAIITTFLIYKVGTRLGTKKTAFTAATFWTFSFLANLNDRHLWALYWGPLISLISLICLHKIINPNTENIRARFICLLGITLAISIHADPSNLVFVLLAIIVWVNYKIPINKSTFFAIAIIIFSFTPLVVFDLRHNFANTRPVLDFIKSGRNNPAFESQKFISNTLLFPRTFTRLGYTFGDREVSKQYSYCRNFISEKFNSIPKSLIIISSIILLYFALTSLKRKNKNQMSKLIATLILLYLLGIQIYGTIFRADIFEHYITGIFPSLLLILAFYVAKLPKKLWILALTLFVGLNFYKLQGAKNDLGLTHKRQAIEYTMQQIGDKSFSLDSLSTCWKLSGYRYLFAVFGREPVKSYVDPNLSYLYGETLVWSRHPQIVAAFIAHDFAPETNEFYRRYDLLKSHELSSSLFGRIEVIIMDNSAEWFDQPQELKNPSLPSID